MIALLAQIDSQVGVREVAPSSSIAAPSVQWFMLAPILVLFGGALVAMLVGSLAPRRFARGIGATTAMVSAGVALAWLVPIWRRLGADGSGPISTVAGTVAIDRFSVFMTALMCVAVILVSLLLVSYLVREDLEAVELFALMLLAACGGSVIVSANDLIVLFVAIEILSLASYVMVAMHRHRLSSQEAGFKYFVLGGFASAVLLYGIALVYGSTGSTNLLRVTTFLSAHLLTDNSMLLGGIALLLVGFGFKVGAAPFHMWTPDVYQGAPTPVTAFMATAVKVAAFGGLLRVFVVGLASYVDYWRPLVALLAVLSLLVGSIAAVRQTNVKRMLAYSSIAHAGFMLVGVATGTAKSVSAVLFYLAAYTVMAIGTFAIVTALGRRGDGKHSLDDYRGLGRARPGLAFVFAVFLFAQAGTPFTAGFLAKFGVIGAAVDQHLWWLGAVAMLSTVISAYLYLRIVIALYFVGEASDEVVDTPRLGLPATLVIGCCLILTIAWGIVPRPIEKLSNSATIELVASPDAAAGN